MIPDRNHEFSNKQEQNGPRELSKKQKIFMLLKYHAFPTTPYGRPGVNRQPGFRWGAFRANLIDDWSEAQKQRTIQPKNIRFK